MPPSCTNKSSQRRSACGRRCRMLATRPTDGRSSLHRSPAIPLALRRRTGRHRIGQFARCRWTARRTALQAEGQARRGLLAALAVLVFEAGRTVAGGNLLSSSPFRWFWLAAGYELLCGGIGARFGLWQGECLTARLGPRYNPRLSPNGISNSAFL